MLGSSPKIRAGQSVDINRVHRATRQATRERIRQLISRRSIAHTLQNSYREVTIAADPSRRIRRSLSLSPPLPIVTYLRLGVTPFPFAAFQPYSVPLGPSESFLKRGSLKHEHMIRRYGTIRYTIAYEGFHFLRYVCCSDNHFAIQFVIYGII